MSQEHHAHRLNLHRRNAKRLGVAFWLNVSAALAWLVMIPVSVETGLKNSLPYLVSISVYALFAAHVSAALAALAGKSGNEVAVAVHSQELSQD